MIRKMFKVIFRPLLCLAGILLVLVFAWGIWTTRVPHAPTAEPCTEAWFSYLEENYFSTSDEEEHGPDEGDSEWFYAFEQKAKLPDGDGLPKQLRCQRIQDQLRHRTYVINQPLELSFSF